MTNAVLNVKRWGNNLGVRLPVGIAREAGLHVNQRDRIEVENGRVIITPLVTEPLSLAQRLEHFDPMRHGGEALQTTTSGAEQW